MATHCTYAKMALEIRALRELRHAKLVNEAEAAYACHIINFVLPICTDTDKKHNALLEKNLLQRASKIMLRDEGGRKQVLR